MVATKEPSAPIYGRDTDIAGMLSISRSQVWRAVRQGWLPPPLYLGPKTARWRFTEIEKHLQDNK